MASVLYALAGKLAGELCSPLFNNYVGKPWELGTKSEIQKLINTVSSIQAVLLDAEEKQTTNNQVKDWLIKIKLVFYDLEDLLQEVSYEALKRRVKTRNKKLKKVHIFFSRSNQLKYRFKMGRKVKLIREQLDAIASDSYRFSLAQRHQEMVAATKSQRREETHSFVPIDQFIGRDEDKQYVTKLLLESGGLNNVSVISIVGIGGLGKTTLAQSIYSLEEVKCNFELMMWVCVSDPFNVKLICENIIETATKRKSERVQMDGVKDELKKAVDGRKYLLVLDDVWTDRPDEWMKLEVLLTGGEKGSKILITSRSNLVARAANSVATHVLKGLSHEESWALFKQVTFKQGVEPQSSIIVGIGKEVAERSAGVPLAIKTTGSLLRLKEREAEWVDFKKNVLPLVTQDSEGTLVQILKLSYDNLSAPLKRCFAYCAIFPKDWVIVKDELIRMWVAQGLIQLDGTTRSLEDVGEQHFMDLMDRSLFEVDKKDEDGTIHLCKMHDLIHDLALSVGGNEFWSNGSDVNWIDVRTRHAWFSNPGSSLSINSTQKKKLRTLVARNPFRGVKDVVNTGGFKQLRVLKFYNLNAARVLEFIVGLRFLTYLDLSRFDFELLPECLCNMYNLQTLILQWCKKLKELPKGTRNLVSLRHLDVSYCYNLSHMPRGMGELTSLHTLTDFVMGPEGVDCSELGELKSLVNLRGLLRIRKLRGSKVGKRRSSGQSCNPTTLLAELQFITRLELWWKEEDGEADRELESLKPHPKLESLELREYRGKRIPRWMERANIGDSLPNIRSISLHSCKGWRHLTPLGLLPSLRQLDLVDMGDLEYLIYDDNEEDAKGKNPYFPVLEKMTIRNCPLLVVDGKQFTSLNSLHELTLLEMETLPGWLPSLPHLQTLLLFGCQEMVSLPDWMGDLKSLQEIRLIFCESLASIPDCVIHLTSLQRLEVRHCEEIIDSATKRKCERVQMDGVKDELKKAVDGRKYLLVLDDVWNESRDQWMKLEVLLAGGAKGSKILVTTRQKKVARTANSIEIHVLEGLPHDKSWDLFKQVAFKQGVESESSTIVGIGKEVVERCAGVPLVIKTTGSLLGLKEREADWVDFKKNDLPLVTKDSEGGILPILKLSYDNLTAPLKRCFAYCAIFPKDSYIEKDVLIRMWMGQGLIQLDGTSRSLEDVGEQHFMELMDRSLFEVDEKDEDGTIRWCKMHDLIHDLALSVGGDEFWSDGSDVNCIDVRTRHAWFSNPGPSLSTNLTQAKKLRTLVAKKSYRGNEDVVVTGDFKQLRVLHLHLLKAARVLEFVAGLRVLTYLNLSGSDFELLPECLCNMYNLQTLILYGCFNMKELPKGTRNLVSLRHLDVSECDELSHMPRGLGELTNLRTLTNFVMGPEGADCSELGELKSLVNLRGELRIRNLRSSKVGKRRSSGKRCNPTHPLAELQFITRLMLQWKEDEEEEEADRELEILKPHPNLERLRIRNYGGKRIPSWMERANIGDSLPNIRSITLWKCKGWRHLPPVGLLPSLRQLVLRDMGDLEYLIYDDKEEDAEGKNRYYFPALEKLRIQNCPLLVVDGKQFMNLREVVFAMDDYMETLPGWLRSLPHLQTLKLDYCSKVVSLPEWMGDLKSLQEIRLNICNSLASIPDCVLHLTSLQRLEVDGCPELYRRYNKESGEDWHQISHIPNVEVSEWVSSHQLLT